MTKKLLKELLEKHLEIKTTPFISTYEWDGTVLYYYKGKLILKKNWKNKDDYSVACQDWDKEYFLDYVFENYGNELEVQSYVQWTDTPKEYSKFSTDFLDEIEKHVRKIEQGANND